MNAAIVIKPTAVTEATRTPVIITGSASGICTLVKIWNRVKPLAASSV